MHTKQRVKAREDIIAGIGILSQARVLDSWLNKKGINFKYGILDIERSLLKQSKAK